MAAVFKVVWNILAVPEVTGVGAGAVEGTTDGVVGASAMEGTTDRVGAGVAEVTTDRVGVPVEGTTYGFSMEGGVINIGLPRILDKA
eukprot:480215-Ditylum_brightwellii.AAC.1